MKIVQINDPRHPTILTDKGDIYWFENDTQIWRPYTIMGLPSELFEEKQTKSAIVPPKALEYSDSFMQFWNRYPKKVGKPKAYGVWRANMLHTKTPLILRGLELWITSAQWSEPKYITNPVKWLAEEFYDYEPEQAKKQEVAKVVTYNGETVRNQTIRKLESENQSISGD